MYITINSEFKPFTYDELTKPLRDYTEAYNKVEEQYATLAQQTEAWKNIATQENSPEAYAMYKRYSDELNAVIDDFSRGMTVQNRSKLTGLKSRYSSEIGAIDQAYKAMQAANAYRDQALLKDPSAVFTVDRYHSLDDFLGGKSANNSYISGKQLESTLLGKVYAEANAKFTELTGAGMSVEDAAKHVTSGKAFNIDEIIDSELEELGIQNFDEVSKEKIRTYVNSGVNQGFGSFIDKQTLTAAQRADNELRRFSIGEQRRQFNANMAAKGLNTDGSINPDSPVWKIEGVNFVDNGNGTVTVQSGGNAQTIDGGKYFNNKGTTYLYAPNKIASTKIVKLGDITNKTEIENNLYKVYSNVGYGTFSDDTEIEIITLKKDYGGGTLYRIHSSDPVAIPKGQNIQSVNPSGTLIDPNNYK